jgi:hypothetical protein
MKKTDKGKIDFINWISSNNYQHWRFTSEEILQIYNDEVN